MPGLPAHSDECSADVGNPLVDCMLAEIGEQIEIEVLSPSGVVMTSFTALKTHTAEEIMAQAATKSELAPGLEISALLIGSDGDVFEKGALVGDITPTGTSDYGNPAVQFQAVVTEALDEFDESSCASGLAIGLKGTQLIKRGGADYICAYGKAEVNTGHRVWHVRVDCAIGNVLIGVASPTGTFEHFDILASPSSLESVHFVKSPGNFEGYMRRRNIIVPSFERCFESGDIITVEVDITAAKVTFLKNNEPFDERDVELPQSLPLRLFVALDYTTESVTLVRLGEPLPAT